MAQEIEHRASKAGRPYTEINDGNDEAHQPRASLNLEIE